MDNFELYLKPTEAIDSEHEAIQTTAEKLTHDCVSEVEKAIKLFYFVRDSIPFNPHMISIYPEDFKASTVLARGKGFCIQKAVLLTALGRAARIPSRLTFAKIKNHRLSVYWIEQMGTNVMTGHGYNQFFLNEKWITVAATFDRELCEKNGFRTVEFDGIHDAVLPQTDLNGNPHIEYLEKYSPQADLPLEWVIEEVSRFLVQKRERG
jgi:transglutaminase-like putative cysteine protease